jgi:hypothetical protein
MVAVAKVKYIVLNGPKLSGKSTVARWLTKALSISDELQTAIQDEPAAPMKHFVATLLGEKYSQMNKDKPRAELQGRSVREFIIDMSETYFKPLYGDDFFGRMLVYRSLRKLNPKPDYVVLESSQNGAEIYAIPTRFVVRLVRNGTSFEGDGRDYLPDPNAIVHNFGTLDDLHHHVTHTLVPTIKDWALRQ